MKKLEAQEIIESEYKRAKEFYSPVEPTYQAQLTLGQEDARVLPINLTEIYAQMGEQIDTNPDVARSYARTFGATRVLLALDNSPTNVVLNKYGVYPKGSVEIATVAERRLGDIVCAAEIDCPITYILADSGEPQTVEMSLVQAMHMVDTAMATGLSNSATLLVRKADVDTLLELKEMYPDLFLRTYGNVRGLSRVPTILGAVIKTELLEASGIATEALKAPAAAEKPLKEPVTRERITASFIGITTAKRPHIGHGLLIAKAMADSPNGKVLVELNDQGPRVEQMITALASERDISVEEVVLSIESGEISLEDIEQGYKNRRDAPILPPGITYGLAPSNAYYRQLLGVLQPPGVEILTIANSEMGELETGLQNREGYEELFDGTGMDVFRDKAGNGMVAKKAGKKTLQGMIAQLAFGYKLTMVDSPPSLTRPELAILRKNGLELESGMGCGLLLDFSSASGTNGRSVLLESLQREEMQQGSVLAAIRKVMDRSTFFVSETGSLCPNFASNDVFLRAVEKELASIDPSEIEETVRRPIKYADIRKQLIIELLQSVYKDFPVTGKIKVGEVCKLLNLFPVLAKKLPGKVIAAAANLQDDVSIPKNLYQGAPLELLQRLRSLDAKLLCELMETSCRDEDMFLSSYIGGTGLGDIISQMGYQGGSTMEAVKKVLTAKGVFKIV